MRRVFVFLICELMRQRRDRVVKIAQRDYFGAAGWIPTPQFPAAMAGCIALEEFIRSGLGNYGASYAYFEQSIGLYGLIAEKRNLPVPGENSPLNPGFHAFSAPSLRRTDPFRVELTRVSPNP